MARLLKTSQANVWAWLNKTQRGLPAEHVLTVEALSGVSRHRLRPDIYPRHLTADDGSAPAHDIANQLP